MSPRSSTTSHHDALPPEVVQCVASFLLGVDVLEYDHASPALRSVLNTPEVWRDRLHSHELEATLHQDHRKSPTGWSHEKAAYFQQRSALLRGISDGGWSTRWPRCGDSVALPYLMFSGRKQIRLDVIFSVSPVHAGANTCHGGVLVGFQGIDCLDSRPQSNHVESIPLAFVDSTGALHITVDQVSVSSTPAVATLDLNKWYHLRIAFHGGTWLSGNASSLEVYLNGSLCFSNYDLREFRYGMTSYGQIGTGIRRQVGPLTLEESRNDPKAWRPFHGFIAHASVTSLMKNGEEFVSDLIQGQPDPHEKRAVTSRPCERYAQVLPR